MPFYNMPPCHERVRRFIYSLKARAKCQNLRVLPVGCSLLGRSIQAIAFGNPECANLMIGGVHGSEWLTTLLMLQFADKIVSAQVCGAPIAGVDTCRIGSERSLIIVPCLNPDGMDISLLGAESALFRSAEVIRMNGGPNTSRWQANARGVDLNHNFNAGWKELKQMERDEGITSPGPTKFGGEHPHSEPETRAIAHFIECFQPRNVYTFHSQGEEIYYKYGSNTPPGAELIAKMFAEVSGYEVLEPTGTASHGGLKDWFIDTYSRPGFTFEIGKGKNPLPLDDFPEVYQRLEKMLMLAALI